MYQHKQAKSFLIILLSLSILITSCVEKDFNPDDPGEAFAAAREAYDDGNYDIAIQKLGEFKARFPYSKHAPLAELYIGNSQFELSRYQEAALTYEQFVRLRPNHEKTDFAMFRIGESYWIEAPEEIDREQDFTIKAIEEWEKLVRRFPNSEYTKKAKEHMEKGQRRIAESVNFIVNFYCKQEIYHACAYKAIKLIETYPQFADLRLNALKKAAKSFAVLAEIKQKEPDTDKNIFVRSMSATELKEKSVTFENLAKKLENKK